MTEPCQQFNFESFPPVDFALIRRICFAQAILFVLTSLAFLKVVSRFEKIFKDFDAELPVPTQITLDVSNFYFSHWFVCAALWVAMVVALVMLCRTGCPGIARRLSNAIVVGYCIFFAFVGLAMWLPLAALIDKLS